MKSPAKTTYHMFISENEGKPLMDWQLEEVLNLARLEGSTMTSKEEQDFERDYLNKEIK